MKTIVLFFALLFAFSMNAQKVDTLISSNYNSKSLIVTKSITLKIDTIINETDLTLGELKPLLLGKIDTLKITKSISKANTDYLVGALSLFLAKEHEVQISYANNSGRIEKVKEINVGPIIDKYNELGLIAVIAFTLILVLATYKSSVALGGFGAERRKYSIELIYPVFIFLVSFLISLFMHDYPLFGALICGFTFGGISFIVTLVATFLNNRNYEKRKLAR